METVYYLILVPMTYIAFAVFIVGTLVQAVRIFAGLKTSLGCEVGPHTGGFGAALYETFLMPRVMKAHPVHWAMLMTFHLGFLLLILGHFELVGEVGFMQAIKHEVFLGGGIIGVALTAALAFFLFRRFHAPARLTSAPSDYYLLILLFLTALFGSQLHLARSLFDYNTISVTEYREYLGGLFTFAPALPDVYREPEVGHSFLLVLHVFFANLFLMVFPFSKIMHALVAPAMQRLKRRQP